MGKRGQTRETEGKREDIQKGSEKPEEKLENKVGPPHPERHRRRQCD